MHLLPSLFASKLYADVHCRRFHATASWVVARLHGNRGASCRCATAHGHLSGPRLSPCSGAGATAGSVPLYRGCAVLDSMCCVQRARQLLMIGRRVDRGVLVLVKTSPCAIRSRGLHLTLLYASSGSTHRFAHHWRKAGATATDGERSPHSRTFGTLGTMGTFGTSALGNPAPLALPAPLHFILCSIHRSSREANTDEENLRRRALIAGTAGVVAPFDTRRGQSGSNLRAPGCRRIRPRAGKSARDMARGRR